MIDHAMRFAPRRFAARSKMVVAGLGFHDAHIARGKFLHTRKTMPLGEALFCFATASVANDIPRVAQR